MVKHHNNRTNRPKETKSQFTKTKGVYINSEKRNCTLHPFKGNNQNQYTVTILLDTTDL